MYVEKIPELLPLDLLRSGEVAEVVEVSGDPSRVHQLAEIGLHRGCSIRMVRSGQPSILIVDGRRMSIRLNQDITIYVSPFASIRVE